MARLSKKFPERQQLRVGILRGVFVVVVRGTFQFPVATLVPLGWLGSTFHGQILHQLFGLSFDLFRGVLGRFLNLLGFGLVLLLVVVHGGTHGMRRRKHVLQHVVESVHRFHAVLLESVQPEGSDRCGKAKHRRVDPRRPDGDRFARLVRHASVRDLLNDAHNLVEANVSRVRDEGALLRVDHRFFQDAHGLGLEEALAPLGHAVGFAEQALRVELAVAHLPADGVLGEHVGAKRIRVSIPKALRHLLPRVVEGGRTLVVFRHRYGGQFGPGWLLPKEEKLIFFVCSRSTRFREIFTFRFDGSLLTDRRNRLAYCGCGEGDTSAHTPHRTAAACKGLVSIKIT